MYRLCCLLRTDVDRKSIFVGHADMAVAHHKLYLSFNGLGLLPMDALVKGNGICVPRNVHFKYVVVEFYRIAAFNGASN